MLEMNRLANKSDVYFFVDYPKRDSDKLAHKNIVSLIEENWKFKSKNIIISKLFDRILSLYFLKNIIINYVFYNIKKRFHFFLSKKRNVI